MWKALKWEDWVGVALGVWLLWSPWVLGFSDQTAATMNALFMGTILVLEEFLELGIHENVEEKLDLIAGLWLVASPFVLGFTSTAATVSTLGVGLLTLLFGAWALSHLDDQLAHWWHDHVGSH